jgi:fumarate reductase iron-sulfur subunit
MTEDINNVNILVRREIESLITAPIIQAFSESFGKEKTEATVKSVIQGLAHESGKMLAAFTGGNSVADLKKGLPLFSQGGALEFEILSADDNEIKLNITRCRYAEMYKANGMAEYGYLLSCGRDYALIEGFNPDITLTRKQTIMEGADYCDFCFSAEKNKV